MNPRHTAAPSPIMTVTEVAEYLRIDRSTVYKLLRRNQIPAFKLGVEYRSYRDAIDKWMTTGQAKT